MHRLTKYEGAISMGAAMLVLFTAMLDPRVSVALAVLALGALSVLNFTRTGSQ